MKERRKPVREKIFKTLEKDILSNKYQSNTYLPSENQLTDMFDSSRGTIRSVLSELEQSGLIRINPGKGSCVAIAREKSRKKRFLTGMGIENLHIAEEFMQIIMGICKGAAENNGEAIIAFDAILDSEDIIQRYISGSIDGVIYIECEDYEKRILPLKKAGIPCVVANLENKMECVSTTVDFKEIGRIAAYHLLEHGHKDCALLMGRSFFYQEIIAGFRGALAEENIIFKNENIFLADRYSETVLESEKILKNCNKFSAIFTGRDDKASIFHQICNQSTVNIPKDLSIISYDNITWSGASDIGLTTINEPAEEMGQIAVNLLMEWIETRKKPSSVILSAELIKNRSVI